MTSPAGREVATAGIHYADYHRFRAEQQPRTYRALHAYKKEAGSQIEQRTQNVVLRTSQRGRSRQEQPLLTEEDSQLPSDSRTPRLPRPLPRASAQSQSSSRNSRSASSLGKSFKPQMSHQSLNSCKAQQQMDNQGWKQRQF